MKYLWLLICAFCVSSLSLAQDTSTDSPSSYTTRWTEDGITYRSIMFPHEIDGCKLMVQSRRSGDGLDFYEAEGQDCDCDLVIDGTGDKFRPATGYTSEKLRDVCTGPGVDGQEDRYKIMRERLKEEPNFARMPNVQAH